jgi:hypothetical protein
MGFLKSFFGGDSPSPDIVRKIDLGKYFYLMDYRQQYAEFLSDAPDQKLAISELYIFRAWTTHFGFQIFSSSKDISEKVTYELWNLASTLGQVVLEGKYRIKFADYSSIADSRWQEYDDVYLRNRNSEEPFPAIELGFRAAAFCEIEDPGKIALLATSFLIQLGEIKDEAIRLRILA